MKQKLLDIRKKSTKFAVDWKGSLRIVFDQAKNLINTII